MVEALALWRGPPLADVAQSRFARQEIGRLEERRLAVLEERIETELALGRRADLIAELEALVAGHPLRERLRALLMLALYRGGRQAEALDVYQDARRALVEELGIEPGRELRELHQTILRQDPALEPTVEAEMEERRNGAASDFVGRGPELAELSAGSVMRSPAGVECSCSRGSRESARAGSRTRSSAGRKPAAPTS